jgi:hypothetical protein
VTPKLLDAVSDVANKLKSLNETLIVVSHQGFLSQAAIPSQNFST